MGKAREANKGAFLFVHMNDGIQTTVQDIQVGLNKS